MWKYSYVFKMFMRRLFSFGRQLTPLNITSAFQSNVELYFYVQMKILADT